MTLLFALFTSPVGPPIVLFLGALLLALIGRWLRRPGLQMLLALLFVAVASGLWLQLRLFQAVVPTYSQAWRPLLQAGANLVWVGDGWNWYISGMILLLSAIGILVDFRQAPEALGAGRGYTQNQRFHISLAVHLSVLAASLLFVGSSNLLTTILTWVLLDLLLLVRAHPNADPVTQPALPSDSAPITTTAPAGERVDSTTPMPITLRPTTSLATTVSALPAASADGGMAFQDNQTKGLSLLGALLLLVGLLPAGINGPGQSLLNGSLPNETVAIMLVAALLRAGIYPFHLWLLPPRSNEVNLSERLLEQMVPVLCGLWLLGWAISLGGGVMLLQPEITFLLVISLLCSATAAFGARDKSTQTALVLVTSAGLAALCGALAQFRDPGSLLWPTTAFAFGGGLWLLGERVWHSWRWQLPVSIGALALAGVPFTPGFLTQASVARLLTIGFPFPLFFIIYVFAQSLQIAAMLRSWGTQNRHRNTDPVGFMWRLLIACVLVAIPLAITGFLPNTAAMIAGLPHAIPPMLGNPPSVVAETPVLVTLALPLALGILLLWSRAKFPAQINAWWMVIADALRLDWLLRFGWWSINSVSDIWSNVFRVLEGAGAMGWLLVYLLIAYLLAN